jgi:hypothetical protein
MSNGLKVGILGVIVAALAFFGYTQLIKKDGGDQPTHGQVIGNAEPGAPGTEQASDVPKTTISFDQPVHDFGTIKHGEKVSHNFKITNTGSNPLTITNAKGSCGCTVPEYPTDPIAPGETRDIKVTFNSEGKHGEQTKNVTLTANTQPSETIITIKGFVEVEGYDDMNSKNKRTQEKK